MKSWICCALVAAMAVSSAHAFESDFADSQLEEGEPRIIGLINVSNTATSLTLLGALLLLGVIGYLIYAGGLLGGSSSSGYNRNDYAAYGQYDNYDGQYAQYRSNDDGYDFNSSLNIIQWISMLQDLYEKFDYNDLECQKRLICEVMREPEYYGGAALKFKAGFQYAKYLEVLSLPDDMRELLDEYLDANSRADSNKECEEYFQCPYSIKDSFKRNISGNHVA